MTKDSHHGTQLVGRVANILRFLPLMSASGKGKRLFEIARATNLNESTTRRILQALVREGFVKRDAKSKRYGLGRLPLELGLAAGYADQVVSLCRASLVQLAQISGCTSVLTCRNGMEAVALLEVPGSYPINVRLMEILPRAPLGVSSGGIALMIQMTDRESCEVFENAEYNKISLDRTSLIERVRNAREKGYVDIVDFPINGIRGIGVPLPSVTRYPPLSISIVTTKSQLTDARVMEVLPMLNQVAGELGKLLGD